MYNSYKIGIEIPLASSFSFIFVEQSLTYNHQFKRGENTPQILLHQDIAVSTKPKCTYLWKFRFAEKLQWRPLFSRSRVTNRPFHHSPTWTRRTSCRRRGGFAPKSRRPWKTVQDWKIYLGVFGLSTTRTKPNPDLNSKSYPARPHAAWLHLQNSQRKEKQ